jgi:hypothetical protein
MWQKLRTGKKKGEFNDNNILSSNLISKCHLSVLFVGETNRLRKITQVMCVCVKHDKLGVEEILTISSRALFFVFVWENTISNHQCCVLPYQFVETFCQNIIVKTLDSRYMWKTLNDYSLI